MKLIGSVVLLTALNAGIVLADSSGVFGIRSGIGYDYISQEYFLDSLRLAGEDSLVTATLLKRQYLDDKKAFLYFSMDNRLPLDGSDSYYLEAGWEQTDEIMRGVAHASYGASSQKNRFNAELDLDLKKRYRGETSPGEEVTVLDSRLKYSRGLSEKTSAGLTLYGEGVWFDSATSFVYDYNRIGLTAGLDLLSDNFNAISVSLTGELRNVPDSSDLDYKLVRGNVGFLGSLLNAYGSANLALEYRNYRLPGNLDDYFLASFYAAADWPLSRNYYLSVNPDLEIFDYSSNDFVNSDYFLGRLDLLLKRSLGPVTLSAGPAGELYSVSTEFIEDDDYYELGAKVGMDYVGLGGSIILLENQVGFRNYKTAQIYTSDFTFDRLTLIGSARIWDGLSFDLFLSAEWEWHQIDSDDNRIYLITTSVSYTF